MDETFYFPRISNTMEMAECSFSIISLFISLNGWFFDAHFGILFNVGPKNDFKLRSRLLLKNKRKKKEVISRSDILNFRSHNLEHFLLWNGKSYYIY